MSGDYPNNYDDGIRYEYNYSYQKNYDNNIPLYMLIVMCFCCMGAYFHEYYNRKVGNRTIYKPLLLDSKRIKNETRLSEGCVICLEKYNENEEIIILECKHIFHIQSIEEWFLKNKSCPLCRFSLL